VRIIIIVPLGRQQEKNHLQYRTGYPKLQPVAKRK
jgi:hypothetical protein